MLRLLTALAVLVGLINHVSAAPARPYGSEALVPVVATRYGVRAVINGSGPFLLMVDTATSHTVLTPRTAQRLGLKPAPGSPTRVFTAAGSVVSSFYRLNEVAVAGAILEQLDAVLIDIPGSMGIDGILGTDFLANFTLDLDFRSKRMTLYPHGSVPRVTSARRIRGRLDRHGLVVLPGQVERVRVNIVIDTGARVTIANPALSMASGRAGRYTATLMDNKIGDIANLKTLAQAEIYDSISLGPVTWRQRPVLISSMRVFEEIGLSQVPTMFIGVDLMGSRRIIFDHAAGSVFIEPQ